jgi:DNA-binding response OmpR family regulator
MASASLRLPPAEKPYRVLLIEDDAEVERVIIVNLRLKGYECMSVADGLAGLEIMQTFQPHLVLLDMMLPGMSGTKVLDAIRSQSDIPIIIVSALANEPDSLAWQSLHDANDILGKPFRPADLMCRTRALLTRFYES